MVKFYSFEEINDEELKFAVIGARCKNKWIFVMHKERDTYEIPGGHREKGETISKCAARELIEETGAIDFQLKKVCVYSVSRKDEKNQREVESFGGLFLGDIKEIGKLPQSEIKEVFYFEDIPENLTYKDIMPKLHQRLVEALI